MQVPRPTFLRTELDVRLAAAAAAGVARACSSRVHRRGHRGDGVDGLGGRLALGGGVTRLVLLLRCDGAADRARREARSGGGGGRRARARACSGATRAQLIGVVQFLLPLGGHGGGGSRNSRGVGGVMMRAGGALQKWLWQASAAARLGRARHDAEEGDPACRAVGRLFFFFASNSPSCRKTQLLFF